MILHLIFLSFLQWLGSRIRSNWSCSKEDLGQSDEVKIWRKWKKPDAQIPYPNFRGRSLHAKFHSMISEQLFKHSTPFMTIAIHCIQMPTTKQSLHQLRNQSGEQWPSSWSSIKELGLSKKWKPLQGSFIIEELTDLVEEAVLIEFDRITERGWRIRRNGDHVPAKWNTEESLYYEMLKHTGEFPLIGVNTFLSKEGSPNF